MFSLLRGQNANISDRLTAFNVECYGVRYRTVFANTDLIVSADTELISCAWCQVINQRTASRHKWYRRHPHAHPSLLELHRVPGDWLPAIKLWRLPFQHERGWGHFFDVRFWRRLGNTCRATNKMITVSEINTRLPVYSRMLRTRRSAGEAIVARRKSFHARQITRTRNWSRLCVGRPREKRGWVTREPFVLSRESHTLK